MNASEEVTVLLCAFRYTIGRRGYPIRDIAEILISRWGIIPHYTRKLIVDEIISAIDKNKAGSNHDEDQWMRVVKHDDKE